jgi:hypothetical protein
MRLSSTESRVVAGNQAVHVSVQLFQNPLIHQSFQIELHSAPFPGDASFEQNFLKITDQDRGVGSSWLQVTDGRQDEDFVVHPCSLKGRLSPHSDKGQWGWA